jgi:hypothetical protein
MHLVGQLSNPSPSQKRTFEAFSGGIPMRTYGAQVVSSTAMRLGNGAVCRGVTRVLADGQPMKLADIRTAVETICGGSVSIESVSWCLRMGSRKDPARFERVARGVYRLSPQT